MPARPSNIGGQAELLHVVNQSIRELNIRIDNLGKVIPIHRIVAASGLLNFGTIPANSSVERQIRMSGASQKGSASASPQLQIGDHLQWSAYIPSSGLVTVRLSNPTGSPIVANTVMWNASVTQT